VVFCVCWSVVVGPPPIPPVPPGFFCVGSVDCCFWGWSAIRRSSLLEVKGRSLDGNGAGRRRGGGGVSVNCRFDFRSEQCRLWGRWGRGFGASGRVPSRTRRAGLGLLLLHGPSPYKDALHYRLRVYFALRTDVIIQFCRLQQASVRGLQYATPSCTDPALALVLGCRCSALVWMSVADIEVSLRRTATCVWRAIPSGTRADGERSRHANNLWNDLEQNRYDSRTVQSASSNGTNEAVPATRTGDYYGDGPGAVAPSWCNRGQFGPPVPQTGRRTNRRMTNGNALKPL